MKRIVKCIFILIIIGLACLIAFLGVRYHTSSPYPDLTQKPLLDESALEVYTTTNKAVGNVTVNKQGRLFMTVHPEARPMGTKLMEFSNGQWRAYPNKEFQKKFTAPMGMVINEQNRLFVLDHGFHATSKPKLYVFDLDLNMLMDEYTFERNIAPIGSYLQDLQADKEGHFIYIADASFWRMKPGVVILDLKHNKIWRKLDKHEATMPMNYKIINPIKAMVFFKLIGFRVGLDGIALSHDERWLYLAAMNHAYLYRVPIKDLHRKVILNIQRLSTKPLSDGLSIDENDTVYITDIEHGAIHTWNQLNGLKTLIKSPKIRWADALSFGPDGYLYIADSAIPELVLQSRSHIKKSGPYTIYRIKLPVKGRVGH